LATPESADTIPVDTFGSSDSTSLKGNPGAVLEARPVSIGP